MAPPASVGTFAVTMHMVPLITANGAPLLVIQWDNKFAHMYNAPHDAKPGHDGTSGSAPVLSVASQRHKLQKGRVLIEYLIVSACPRSIIPHGQHRHC